MKESELVASIAARLLAPEYRAGERLTERQVKEAVGSAYDLLNCARRVSRLEFEARERARDARGAFQTTGEPNGCV